MSDAAFREPPFSAGEHEKGFRDAVIAEAVGQIVASSASDCRIAVVAGDELLSKAIVIKTGDATQSVHVISTIEELKGLISTLVSNVDEDFIQQMRSAAERFFFEQGNLETFIYKEQIKEAILRDFHSLIYAVPEDANEVKRGKALVSRPRFKEKVDDRMYWVSRIAFRMEAYDDTRSASSVAIRSSADYSGLSGYSGYTTIDDETLSASDLQSGEAPSPIISSKPVFSVFRVPSKTGYVSFDVIWSVSVTPQMQLTDPNVESIDYVETGWGQ
ncbi:MAG TPA: hypothetical protein VF088_15440 [Pyrinomonadaceae bacterium]